MLSFIMCEGMGKRAETDKVGEREGLIGNEHSHGKNWKTVLLSSLVSSYKHHYPVLLLENCEFNLLSFFSFWLFDTLIEYGDNFIEITKPICCIVVSIQWT